MNCSHVNGDLLRERSLPNQVKWCVMRAPSKGGEWVVELLEKKKLQHSPEPNELSTNCISSRPNELGRMLVVAYIWLSDKNERMWCC